MGRHSAGPEPAPQVPEAGPPTDPADPQTPDAGTPADRAQPSTHRLTDRLALAVAAGGGTGAVMAWAGAAPAAYLLGGAGIAVVVVVAAQLAGSVPGAPRTRTDGRSHRDP